MAKKNAKDDEASDEVSEGKAKGKLSGLLGNKKLLIGVAAAILLAGGGGGYWFVLRGKPAPEAASPAASGDPKGAAAPTGAKRVSAFLDLPEMTVNLAAGGQQDRQQFLRMKIALEVGEQKLVPEIQPKLPVILDTFQVFMRELRPQDLEGSAGLYRLKEEMTRRVNVAVYPSRVDAVLFKELMVQ